MTQTATITVELHNLPTPMIDDRVISGWIERRLNDARNTFIRNVSRGGGGGRLYGKHRASAPGEYPATGTGRLVNSVHFQMNSPREGVLDSDLVYADYLTGGTQYMLPRRMLGDALSDVIRTRPEFDKLAGAARFVVHGLGAK